MRGTVHEVGIIRSERCFRFVDKVADGADAWMRFTDPVVTYVVAEPDRDDTWNEDETADQVDGDTFSVKLLPLDGVGHRLLLEGTTESAVYIKSRGVELWWLPGRAVLQCDAEQAESLLSAVVEFAYYERELRRTEREIAEAWEELEQDKALAFDVTPADLKRSQITGARMASAFQRRIRHARVEPHLYAPDAKLPALAQKLGEDLRERSRVEARAEAVDGQLEVFEHIYEMASQRLGEYKAARQGHMMEAIIIWLLAAEALLMLAQTLLKDKI